MTRGRIGSKKRSRRRRRRKRRRVQQTREGIQCQRNTNNEREGTKYYLTTRAREHLERSERDARKGEGERYQVSSEYLKRSFLLIQGA